VPGVSFSRARRRPENAAPRPTPLSWASGFDGHAQELRECSATLERAFADVERADLGPGLFDDFAFLIDLLSTADRTGLCRSQHVGEDCTQSSLQCVHDTLGTAWQIVAASFARTRRHVAPSHPRLRGWGERTRTRKCRFFVISAELLGFARGLKQSHSMRMKRKAIAIINRNHLLIRLSPSPRRMEFSEATGPRWGNTPPWLAFGP
jgi:hypothetical protein